MFEEFLGVPAHPLLVHAAVVFVPLLAILTIAYSFIPFVRAHIRWTLGLLAVVTPVAALLAKLSGDAFLARLDAAGRITAGFYPTLETHQRLGALTLYATLALALVTLTLVVVIGPRVAAASTARVSGSRRVLSLALKALALVTAAISLYYVIRTGDSGAKAVWSGS